LTLNYINFNSNKTILPIFKGATNDGKVVFAVREDGTR